MQIGALTAFLSYLLQILMSVMMATFMFMMVPRAEVCAERIIEVLDTEPDVRPARRARCTLAAVRGQLELRDVEFRYPGAEQPVLRDISLMAGPGEVTAIIGGTGSGKTTLLSLIPRLFDVTGGAVLVDGVDVRELDPALLSAADRPGAAEAVPVLRHRRVQPALRQARTPPTPSCGRRWRSPRRATSSSGCRAGSTRRSPRAARTCPAASGSGWPSPGRWCTSRRSTCSTTRSPRSTTPPTPRCAPRWPRRPAAATVIIVAQRVATIRHADQIVVLDAGRVVATGTHAELMATDETYREIVLSQLTEQEAAA